MQKKSSKQKRGINDCKQNMTQNSEIGHMDIKHKNIKKHKLQSHYPLSQLPRNRDPQQLRHLCQQQQKQILAQYRASCTVQHSQFYQYVRGQLADSQICDKIMHIKHMSNQQAVQEFLRVQHSNKAKLSQRQTDINVEIQERTVFRHLGKKMSMIQQNDDAYLEELGGLNIQPQNGQPIQDELEEHYEEPVHKQGHYSSFSQHQYYQNDDVFEF